MASITIRDLEPELKERLRVRAAGNGRSMEDEARVILRAVVTAATPPTRKLGDAIHRRFDGIGVELEIAPRMPGREPPKVR